MEDFVYVITYHELNTGVNLGVYAVYESDKEAREVAYRLNLSERLKHFYVVNRERYIMKEGEEHDE